MKQYPLSLEQLRDLLHYEPSTGIFTWLMSRGGTARTGTRAGSPTLNGYRRVVVAGHPYLEHRLAWFYMNGVWPPEDTDHINGDRLDNRISNLRLATRSQNNSNTNKRRKAFCTSPYKGVSRHKKSKSNPWVAQISVGDENIGLGYYPTAESARDAYVKAVEEYYGEFGRVA